jgi:predicted secreted protein
VDIVNSTSSQPTFVAPNAVGTLTFELLVRDNRGLTSTDQVVITVVNNPSPIAIAGADQQVRGGASVTLDGSASNDPQGEAITYRWEQIGGIDVTFTGGDTPVVQFTAPNDATTITFRLTVTDSNSLSSSDDVVIVVERNSGPTGGRTLYLPMMVR